MLTPRTADGFPPLSMAACSAAAAVTLYQNGTSTSLGGQGPLKPAGFRGCAFAAPPVGILNGGSIKMPRRSAPPKYLVSCDWMNLVRAIRSAHNDLQHEEGAATLH